MHSAFAGSWCYRKSEEVPLSFLQWSLGWWRGCLGIGQCLKKTPWRKFSPNICNRPRWHPIGFDYVALGWPLVCSSEQYEETRSDSAQTSKPYSKVALTRWFMEKKIKEKSTLCCSPMCYHGPTARGGKRQNAYFACVLRRCLQARVQFLIINDLQQSVKNKLINYLGKLVSVLGSQLVSLEEVVAQRMLTKL